MDWSINIQDEAVDSLADLTEDASNKVLEFIEHYLPKHPNPSILAGSKQGDLQGLRSFSTGTSQEVVRIFASINYDSKEIKILHVASRNQSYNRKHKKQLKKLLDKYT